MCSNLEAVNEDLKAVGALPQDDVDQRSAARAPTNPDVEPNQADQDIPSKKRKRRRGRNNKRRHPYLNRNRKTSNPMKVPEAPHNSNQFLIEDQGNSKEIDEQLKNDKIPTRTRDSSFSMDSDCDFYSSPEDEESYLRKDFDDTYENLRAERLNQMSKNELIEEFLQLEKRVDFLNKRIKAKFSDMDINVIEEEKANNDNIEEFRKEIERLLTENETLKRENNDLRNKIPVSNTDSKDSESDSSDSCSSCTSSGSESVKEVSVPASPEEPPVVDYTQTNGHSPSNLQPV